MKIIPLTQGLETLVDDEDYDELSKYSWYAVGHKGQEYAARYGRKPIQTHIRMHRELLNAPAGLQVDHINGNRLDNRKANLRLATQAENSRNRGKFSSTALSQYKGATYHKRDGVWQSSIKVDGKLIYIGSFSSEIQAAKAYNEAAKKYHGLYANLNRFKEENNYGKNE